MPYLLRLAQENSDLLGGSDGGGAARELQLLWAELARSARAPAWPLRSERATARGGGNRGAVVGRLDDGVAQQGATASRQPQGPAAGGGRRPAIVMFHFRTDIEEVVHVLLRGRAQARGARRASSDSPSSRAPKIQPPCAPIIHRPRARPKLGAVVAGTPQLVIQKYVGRRGPNSGARPGLPGSPHTIPAPRTQ